MDKKMGLLNNLRNVKDNRSIIDISTSQSPIGGSSLRDATNINMSLQNDSILKASDFGKSILQSNIDQAEPADMRVIVVTVCLSHNIISENDAYH